MRAPIQFLIWLIMMGALMGSVQLVKAQQTRTIRLGDERPLVQTPDYVHQIWTVEDGLPVTAVRDVAQTPDGLIWLATIEGLVRFDGLSFTVFNSTNTPAVKYNRLFSVRATDDGWLIVQREDNSIFTRAPDGTFEDIAKVEGGVTLIQGNQYLPEFVLYQGDGNGGERYAYTGDGSFSVIREPPGLDRFENLMFWIAKDDQWTWFVDWKTGIHRWNADSTFSRLSYPGLPEDVGVRMATRSESGTIWLLHSDLSVSRLEDTRLVKELDPTPFEAAGPHNADCFERMADGSFIFGLATPQWSLYRLNADGITLLDEAGGDHCSSAADQNGNSWTKTDRSLLRNGERVATHSFQRLIPGRNGDFWLGSEEGLHRISLTPVTVIHQLPDDNTYGMLEDDQGRIWIKNWGNQGGSVLDGERLWDVSLNREAMAQAADGTLWASFPGGLPGLQAFDPDDVLNGSAQASLVGLGDMTEVARMIFHDSSGRIWVGAENGIHERQGPRIITVATRGARTAVEEPPGIIWFGGADGVSVFRDGSWSAIQDSLLAMRTRGMMADPDIPGRIWIATEDQGLRRMDVSTTGQIDTVAALTTEHGLFQDGLHHLVQDDFGRMWFNSNFGVFWVDKTSLNEVADGTRDHVVSYVFNHTNGLLNREGNGGYHASALKSRDGRLWFANQKGVVVVDPRAVPSPIPFPSRVVGLSVRGEHIPFTTTGVNRLALGQRDFEVAFTSAEFDSPESLSYQFRLVGYDDQWQMTDRRSMTFTNLSPGEYDFEVRVAVTGQPTEIAQLQLRIPHFWYETWWFLGALILFIGGMAAAVPTLRLRASLRAREELNRLVAERTAALQSQTLELKREKSKSEAQAEDLRLLNEAKNRLFANLSHEFRTPLTLISGPLGEFLKRPENPDRDVHELMKRNADELLKMVNRILDLARLENKTLPFNPTIADLAAVVRQQSHTMSSLAERSGLRMTVRSPESVMASFDAELMDQILSNLFSNAIKFTPQGGTITTELRKIGDQISIEVRDTGIGIAPEHIEIIFDRFFQVDSSSTRRQDGAGIGLSLVKELVQLHHGTISVSSEPGVGSRFVVRIPVPKEHEMQSLSLTDGPHHHGEGNTSGEATGQPERESPEAWDENADDLELTDDNRTTILLVDDHADIRLFIRSVLDDSFIVREASDGRKALEEVEQNVPDIIISDVMMPRMDGFELNSVLKSHEETATIPFIFLTALAEEEYRLKGIMTDADLYITKPFDASLLLEQIRSVLRRRARLRAKMGATAVESAKDGRNTEVKRSAFEEKVRALILEHLTDEELNARKLAEIVGLSYSQLHRKLKNDAQRTPTELIRIARLEVALPLIKAREGTISEIAFAVGFNSLSYFNRCFQAEYGMSPTAYQRAE